MKEGADDYVLKENLNRLPAASMNALDEWNARREQERMWESLRQSEEHFRLLVDGVRDHAMYMIDPDGNIASWNRGATRVYGCVASDVIGRPIAMLYPKEDVGAGLPLLSLKRAQENVEYSEEGRRVRKDGTVIWVREISTELRPGVLDELGSIDALEWQART